MALISSKSVTRSLLGMLIGMPLLWLVMFDDGRRAADIFILELTGKPSIGVPLDGLYPNLTPADIRAKVADAELTCAEQAGDFGDSLCHGPIASFNDVPAGYASFFFRDGRLSAVKLNYQRAYHGYLIGRLLAALGEPRGLEPLTWHAGGGSVLLAGRELGESDEPALLWLATTR